MAGLVFDESTLVNGNIFKYENRLHSKLNRFIESGPTIVTYFRQAENETTVNRGMQDINELFGNHSPIRYFKINNFPVYGFQQATPENTDEQQIEDINVEGDCIILPTTVVPKAYDCFIVNHIKMNQIFIVTNVTYDTMKQDGYYRIHYRLQSTSAATIQNIEEKLTIKTFYFDMNKIGTDSDPILSEEDSVTERQINQMVSTMIIAYRSLFYNERHNCFLYRDQETGMDWFDMCGNEFIAKYSLMNIPNDVNVIVLNNKLTDPQFPLRYNDSVYAWLELGAPKRFLRKFEFILGSSKAYLYSSFTQWNDDVLVMQPLGTNAVGSVMRSHNFFDDKQVSTFADANVEPELMNDYERLIWKFINKDSLSMSDVSPYTADSLISSVRHKDVFLYTPIIIYIIRSIIGTV